MYDGGDMCKPVCKKDGQMRSRYPKEQNSESTRGRLSYLRKKIQSDTDTF